MERKSLQSILRNGQAEEIKKAWESTEAADDFSPLPPGEYQARIVSGELFTSKNGKPGFKLAFEISEGKHAGRRCWHDLYLTPAAIPMTKRDLEKIGIAGDFKTIEGMLERPLPAVFLCKLRLALREDDNGNQSNKLRSFEITGIEPADPFAPKQEGEEKT